MENLLVNMAEKLCEVEKSCCSNSNRNNKKIERKLT